MLAQFPGWSSAIPWSSKCRFQRLWRGIFHLPSRPISGLLILTFGHTHSRLWLHVFRPGLVLILLPLLVDLLVLLLDHGQQLLLLVQQALLLHLLLFDHLQQDSVVQHLCPAGFLQLAARLVSAWAFCIPLLTRLWLQAGPRSWPLRWEGRLPTRATLCRLLRVPHSTLCRLPSNCGQDLLICRDHSLGPWVQISVAWPILVLPRLDIWLVVSFWKLLETFGKITCFLQDLGLFRSSPCLSPLRLPPLSL